MSSAPLVGLGVFLLLGLGGLAISRRKVHEA
ncbi:MAG TPA: LPXTG cell wall anchor domain-containing protein [Actinomycetota bacterium]|nr:LPXTG cell wall anchor domain-containing protein [Actinomycetota bacterium]